MDYFLATKDELKLYEYLYNHPGITHDRDDLAEALRLRKAKAEEAVAAMKARGHIERVNDTQGKGRRVRFLYGLTDAGRQAYEGREGLKRLLAKMDDPDFSISEVSPALLKSLADFYNSDEMEPYREDAEQRHEIAKVDAALKEFGVRLHILEDGTPTFMTR